MAIARLARQAKRPHGFCVKMTAVAIMGFCFIFVWSMFSSSSTSATTQRESFDDIAEPVAGNTRVSRPHTRSRERERGTHEPLRVDEKQNGESDLELKKDEKKINGSVSLVVTEHESRRKDKKEEASLQRKEKDDGTKKLPNEREKDNQGQEDSGDEEPGKEEEEGEVVDGKEEANDGENTEGNGYIQGDGDLIQNVDQESVEKVEHESAGSKSTGKKRKIKGPVFDPNAHYSWRLCSTRSKHNYMPCIDIESGTGRLQSYRHTERSCPKAPPMCLVPLPHEGYGTPVHWPESKLKVLYSNVAHPKLAAFIKKNSWLAQSGEYLTFPQNQTEFKGGVQHYLDSIEEMVPDIEWGKNIRVVLDIGCTDSSFAASLLDKESALFGVEGFISLVVSFDAIHCSGCSIHWHSNGGKLLLEMNRILRPSGYFILSTKHDNIEEEEAMTSLTASVCWNVLAHKTDEVGEVGVKIYQKPESNDIYELRRHKNPPLCKENENPDAAWYVPMKTCLHPVPSAIEQHGTEWPEEWPKRLETYPDWMDNKEKLIADTSHWKAIVEKSYLTGMGIDWSNIRNIMDMKAINGGFAAALAQHKVWVMNVVPVHAPDTLPIIYDRGLVGVYHDWCESFGTYPRSYDLLHADHLFSRLKNRCRQPASIVVEMDRILRPGGWAVIRDKVEILDPLEGILRSLHWEIRMTYAQDREGILCAQKNTWRP
ncbi:METHYLTRANSFERASE PMT28-RELATED [Salix koriyanagi]|uniref:Methyltransferase n=1 Tax=Salix koriyanagi TaxID=2511006 RepID=A0A9Q0TGC1_9ROSI|nr:METHYLTRANSFERASE PMT28-RELATED [Salix koriyanagi]